MKTSKLLEARENANDPVAIVLSFAKDGTSFLDQLNNKKKQSKAVPADFRHTLKISL